MPSTIPAQAARNLLGRDTVAHRTLPDSVKAAFILVAFRRFAQFYDNERQRTQPRNEKACGYDHD